MVDITHYLDEELVCFLQATTRDETLRSMVKRIHSKGYLQDSEEFYQAIINREEIVTTGIGMGVAIPHAKLASYEQFFICLGVLKNGVDWKALDNKPVRLIFMIGGPDNRQTEYLQILSSLTFALRNEEKRKKMLIADSPKNILSILTQS